MKFIVTFVLVFISTLCFSAVDTIQVFSVSMQKQIKTVVITPKHYKKSKERLPVVYLLHGYAGAYDNWVKLVPAMQDHATQNNFIIVCPDGAWSSWYFDSPVDPKFRYETFTATELVQHIDSTYKTISNKNARAITGLSMGGHGALFLAFRHKDVFSACGSMSGVMDVMYTSKMYDLMQRLGDTITNKKYYKDWSVVNLVETVSAKDSLGIMIDCGVDDTFIKLNRAMHQKMLSLKIPHDYIERPGGHSWNYWGNAVKYQLLYFREWFKKKLK